MKKENWIGRKDWPPNVDKKNKNKKNPVYSEDEFSAMLSVADATEHALLYFLAGSGLRIGEAAVAQWCDIGWDAKMITVREKPEFNFKPKDYEQRTPSACIAVVSPSKSSLPNPAALKTLSRTGLSPAAMTVCP